jgi:hypothetical protein
MSESDENDFTEDGQTHQSSPRAFVGDIFCQGHDEESLEINDDDSSCEEMKIDQSSPHDMAMQRQNTLNTV